MVIVLYLYIKQISRASASIAYDLWNQHKVLFCYTSSIDIDCALMKRIVGTSSNFDVLFAWFFIANFKQEWNFYDMRTRIYDAGSDYRIFSSHESNLEITNRTLTPHQQRCGTAGSTMYR
jgi:hypothetical protein